MQSIDPTQVVTIGGLAALMFTGLIGLFVWYIRRSDSDKQSNTDKLIELTYKSNKVLDEVIESQKKNTEATQNNTESNKELRDIMKTNADFAKLLVQMMRAKDNP